MKLSLILASIFLISGLLGCTSYPKALEMEKRAQYGITPKNQQSMPNLRKQRVEEVYVGQRILDSGDLFLGGRLLLVVNEPELIFEDVKRRKETR